MSPTRLVSAPAPGHPWLRHVVLVIVVLLAALLLMAQTLFGQDAAQRPPEVTDSAVARGREIFHGTGGCFGCHGIEAIGTDSGPPLAQGVWMHGPDTWGAIRSRILHGIPMDESTRGVTMPIRGISGLPDADVDAVAAYVWVVSHQAIRAKPQSEP